MRSRTKMTPDRLKGCLRLLGWSVRFFGDQIGHHEKMVRLVLSGQAEMYDAEITDAIEARTRAAIANPLPVVNKARADAARQRREADRARRQALAAQRAAGGGAGEGAEAA